MNNQSYDQSYVGVSTEPTIKQEVIPISSQVIAGSSRQYLTTSMNPRVDLSRSNENIEYISNDMDDDNIQGKNSFFPFGNK